MTDGELVAADGEADGGVDVEAVADAEPEDELDPEADPDPEADGLDLTPNTEEAVDIRVALSNSFGFGGQNTALVFSRWDA